MATYRGLLSSTSQSHKTATKELLTGPDQQRRPGCHPQQLLASRSASDMNLLPPGTLARDRWEREMTLSRHESKGSPSPTPPTPPLRDHTQHVIHHPAPATHQFPRRRRRRDCEVPDLPTSSGNCLNLPQEAEHQEQGTEGPRREGRWGSQRDPRVCWTEAAPAAGLGGTEVTHSSLPGTPRHQAIRAG